MTTVKFIILMAMIALAIADGYSNNDGYKSEYGNAGGYSHDGGYSGHDDADGYKGQDSGYGKGYLEESKGQDDEYAKGGYKFEPFSYNYYGPHGHFAEVAVNGPHESYYKYGFSAGRGQSGYGKY